MTSPRVKNQIWRYGSIAMFCGLPLILLPIIAMNLRQTIIAHNTAAAQEEMLSQIVRRLSAQHSHTITERETASLYLANLTSSLARAELQDRVIKIVESAGGRFAEARTTSTPEQESAGTLAIQVSLAIENKGLLDLLYTLETGLPLLTITNLAVTANNAQRDDHIGTQSTLNVEITVEGHFRNSAG